MVDQGRAAMLNLPPCRRARRHRRLCVAVLWNRREPGPWRRRRWGIPCPRGCKGQGQRAPLQPRLSIPYTPVASYGHRECSERSGKSWARAPNESFAVGVMALGGCCLGSGLILVSQIQAPWQLYPLLRGAGGYRDERRLCPVHGHSGQMVSAPSRTHGWHRRQRREPGHRGRAAAERGSDCPAGLAPDLPAVSNPCACRPCNHPSYP